MGSLYWTNASVMLWIKLLIRWLRLFKVAKSSQPTQQLKYTMDSKSFPTPVYFDKKKSPQA